MNNLLLNIIVVIFNKRLCASVLFRNVLVRSVSVICGVLMTDDKNEFDEKKGSFGKTFVQSRFKFLKKPKSSSHRRR